MMIVGHVKTIGGNLYVVVNKNGTLEKLNKIKWFALLYLEIMQGLNKFLSLPELRKYIKKWKKHDN